MRLVAVPAVLTLVVSVLRLVGELEGWAPGYFGTEAGGGASPVGISWLIPVFGLWFGLRLARNGHWPRSVQRAIVMPLVLTALCIGLAIVNVKVRELPMDQVFLYSFVSWPVAMLLSVVAWPRLWRVLLLYAFLARLPVVVITFVAVHYGWGTHYEKTAPGTPEYVGMEKALALSAAQVLIWIPLTVLGGGVAGAIGAGLFGGRRAT